MKLVAFDGRSDRNASASGTVWIDADSVRTVRDLSGNSGWGHPTVYSEITVEGAGTIGVAHSAKEILNRLEVRLA